MIDIEGLLEELMEWKTKNECGPIGTPEARTADPRMWIKLNKALTALRSGEVVVVDGKDIQGILNTLNYIMQADKTPKYEYGECCADGRPTTVDGQRFLTPKELALQELEYLDACGFHRREGKVMSSPIESAEPLSGCGKEWAWKTTVGSEHEYCTIYNKKTGKVVARHVTIENAMLIVAARDLLRREDNNGN